MNTWTNTIHPSKLEDVIAKITKMNRKAEKLGVPQIEIEVNTVEQKHPTTGMAYKMLEVTLTGRSICLNGWSFVGRIENLEGGNIFSCVHGEDGMKDKYADVKVTRCDHCEHKRNRNAVYIVRHESGEEKVVGSTCLKDFLGCDPSSALYCYDRLDSEFSGFDCGGSSDFDWSVRDWYALSNLIIRHFGWTSGSAAYEDPSKLSTKSVIFDYLYPPKNAQAKSDWEQTYKGVNLENKDYEVADKVTAWINEQEAKNDYMNNLQSINRSKYVGQKHTGTATSAVAVWQRENAPKCQYNDSFFGEVGKRTTKSLKIVDYRVMNTNFGMSLLVTLSDSEGHCLVWWATNAPELIKGETYEITFTVKGHSEFRGVKQTQITRAKVK